MQVGIARPDAAGVRGAERNDGLAREVMAFEKSENDFRSFAPPDGITEENHIVVGEVFAFSLDGRTCRRIVLLTVGTGRRIVVVQILGRISYFRLDAPSRRIGRLDNPVGNAFRGVRAGKIDYQGTVTRRLRVRIWIGFRLRVGVRNDCRFFRLHRLFGRTASMGGQ